SKKMARNRSRSRREAGRPGGSSGRKRRLPQLAAGPPKAGGEVQPVAYRGEARRARRGVAGGDVRQERRSRAVPRRDPGLETVDAVVRREREARRAGSSGDSREMLREGGRGTERQIGHHRGSPGRSVARPDLAAV